MCFSFVFPYISLLRMFVALVVIVSVIITTDWFVTVPEHQGSPYLITIAKRIIEKVPPSSCKCSMKSWIGSDLIASTLNLTLPWLTTTTHDHLHQRHPNLPLELLNGARNRRCSLLPTILRCIQIVYVIHRIESISMEQSRCITAVF